MKEQLFRNRFTPRVRVSIEFPEETRTKQALKDECDINLIMAKHRQTGLITHLEKRQPQFGDFSESVDYQAAVNMVMAAEQAFLDLPAAVRKHYDNDPGAFMAACEDPEQREQLLKLGLIEAPEEPPAPPVAEPEPTPAPPKEGDS